MLLSISRLPFSHSDLIQISVRGAGEQDWRAHSSTELVERTSNPSFMVTLCFREEHVRAPDTEVRVCAQDLRERLTMTRTTLGSATVSLQELATTERVRLRLESPNPEGRAAGFCTVQCWSVEREQVSSLVVYRSLSTI